MLGAMAQPPRVDSDTDAAGAAEHPLAALDPRLSVLPFAPLGHFPTRIHRVDGALSSAVELWVKRDDESGVRYGGNKVSKLEFLIGEARARGAERLVTMGGFGSHHVLATAIYGQAAGMGVDAIVFPQAAHAARAGDGARGRRGRLPVSPDRELRRRRSRGAEAARAAAQRLDRGGRIVGDREPGLRGRRRTSCARRSSVETASRPTSSTSRWGAAARWRGCWSGCGWWG